MKGDKSQVVRVVPNGADERVDCQVECERKEKKRKKNPEAWIVSYHDHNAQTDSFCWRSAIKSGCVKLFQRPSACDGRQRLSKTRAGSIRCWNSANMTYWWCSAFITRFLSATAFSDLSIHTRPRRSLKSLWKSWERCIFDYWRFWSFSDLQGRGNLFSFFAPLSYRSSVTTPCGKTTFSTACGFFSEFFFLVSWENNHWLASVL